MSGFAPPGKHYCATLGCARYVTGANNDGGHGSWSCVILKWCLKESYKRSEERVLGANTHMSVCFLLHTFKDDRESEVSFTLRDCCQDSLRQKRTL